MTDARREAHRVQVAVEGFGATVRGVPSQGEVDFKLDRLDGFARERNGKCRVSFFIAVDPDPEEARAFVASYDEAVGGKVEYAPADSDGSFIRVLAEAAFDDVRALSTAAESAQAVRAAWMSRGSNGADLVSTLGAAGIAVPPLGSTGLSEVLVYGGWSWGSAYVPPLGMYLFEVETVAHHLIDRGRFFALSHAGHGINSYGLSLVTAAGPLAAYVQHGYGGGYSDPVGDHIAINATYSRLHVLLRAAAGLPGDGVRWLVVYSQFRGTTSLVDLDAVGAGASVEQGRIDFATESAVFEAVVERLGMDDSDLGTGGRVSW